MENFTILPENHIVRNVRKFTKILCYRGNVKFDVIYDVFE